MNKDQIQAYITEKLSPDEKLIGFFRAQSFLKLWLAGLIGPIILLFVKMYHVAVTDKGIHVFKEKSFGGFSTHDFFAYNEIKCVKISKGILFAPMVYYLRNGKKLKLKAVRKAAQSVAQLDDTTLAYINQQIS